MNSPMYTNIWFIPGWLFFIIITLSAVVIFGLAVYRKYRLIALGQPENRFDQPGNRFMATLGLVFGQTNVLREGYTGLTHVLIFYGFVVLVIGNVFMLSEAFIPVIGEKIEHSVFMGIIQLLVELFIVFVFIGLAMAAYRRFVIKPDRLEWSPDANNILYLIFGIIIFALLIDVFKYAMVDSPLEKWAFVGAPIGNIMSDASQGVLFTLYNISFWLHLTLILCFLVYLPFSKHMHLFVCPFNEYFQKLTPRGVGSYVDIDEAEEFGAERIEQLKWKDLLDLVCCVECGRCQEGCPAWNSEKPLSPKKLITGLRDHMNSLEKPLLKEGKTPEDATPMVGGIIAEDALWSCTTCGYCEEHCPFAIEHVEKIVEMRRYAVLMSSQYPPELNKFFKNLEVHGNPWEINWQKRADWTKGLDVPIAAEKGEFDVLYWVGCIGALDDSGKKISRAMVSLLNKAGVNYAILGNEEKCTGDSARRIGNEMLFQMLAEMNIEVMNGYGVKKIITHCPHCYHTLKHEYPRFGGEYEVEHHSVFLLDLIKEGKLKPNGKFELNGKACFHDSCYLGRYNNIYDEPREIMQKAGVDLVEMEEHHDKSFCCGGGGGGMWWEETAGNRINVMRSQQAVDTGASKVISACPFCSVMLRDGIGDLGKQEEIQSIDIAEVLDSVT